MKTNDQDRMLQKSNEWPDWSSTQRQRYCPFNIAELPGTLAEGSEQTIRGQQPYCTDKLFEWGEACDFANMTPGWTCGDSNGNPNIAFCFPDVVKVIVCWVRYPQERENIMKPFTYRGTVLSYQGFQMQMDFEPIVSEEQSRPPRVLLRRAVTTEGMSAHEEEQKHRVPINNHRLDAQVHDALHLVCCTHVKDWSSVVYSNLLLALEEKSTLHYTDTLRGHQHTLCEFHVRCPWCPIEISYSLQTCCEKCRPGSFSLTSESKPPSMICQRETPREGMKLPKGRHGVFFKVETWMDLGTRDAQLEPWPTYATLRHGSLIPVNNRKLYVPPYAFYTSIKDTFMGLPTKDGHQRIPRIDVPSNLGFREPNFHEASTSDIGIKQNDEEPTSRNQGEFVSRVTIEDIRSGLAERMLSGLENAPTLDGLSKAEKDAKLNELNKTWKTIREEKRKT